MELILKKTNSFNFFSIRRCCTITPTSELAKQIWKSSIRGVRISSVWSNYSNQVIAQTPYLTPRDVSVIIHSFARIKYKDEKLLIRTILPSVLKYMDEFSVRELVSILAAFRKLEYTRLDCLDLIINQLVMKFPEWTAIDTPLIANSISWFRIFDQSIWRCIEKFCLKNRNELSPLGISLIVGSLGRLDMRNEKLLTVLSRQFIKGGNGNDKSDDIMKQESLSVLVNGFAKLDCELHDAT